MNGQGCSTLSADESGRILDRLAGLEKIVSKEAVLAALKGTNRVNTRRCQLTHEVMVRAVLAMGLLTELPFRKVFQLSRKLRFGEKDDTPHRSSLCYARRRLGAEPLQALHAAVVRPLATPETPGAFYRGLRLMAIDGTVLDAPDSEANAVFGRASGGRGEGAFPQVRKVSLVEVGTHVELDIAVGGWHDSEQTLARLLWDRLPADSLLLEDRGLFSFRDWKTLDSRVKLLVRMKKGMVFEIIKPLADGSYLTKIYRNSSDRKVRRGGIVTRMIEYTHDDPQRVGCGETHRLMTNLLDDQQYPASELIAVYHERWEIELVFDEQKTHHDPRRAEKPANLRSESPEGVRQELYALSLAHDSVRAMIVDAAKPEQLAPNRLSFKGCLQILKYRLGECDGRSPQAISAWYEAVLEEMRQERLPARSHRINPRVIKRKMSKWPKKRCEHRRPGQKLKPFAACVVMLN